MKKILIFEPNSNQAQSIVKYIKQYSDYYIVGVTENEIRFNRKNYDEVIVEDYLNINLDKYNYILPMGANSTYHIISTYQKFSYFHNIKFDIQNLIVFNKEIMLNIAKNIDIPIPHTYYELEAIEKYPIFYKENFEKGGGTRGVAVNLESIPKHKNLIYQEYIDTPSTYGVAFLAKNGKILTSTSHKEVLSYPKDGGSAVVIESFVDERILKYTRKIIEELNYDGWGLSEFKYCNKRNDFVFMEINGKFWASIEFMLRENPKFLKYLLNIKYSKIETKRILFINRLFLYSTQDIFKNIKYFNNAFILKEGSLIYQIIHQWTPRNFIDMVKKII